MIDDHLTRGLKSKDVAERRRTVALLENTTVFDWVSDRDERDISVYIPAIAEALSDEDKGVRDGAMSAIFAAQGDRQDVQAAVPAMLSIIQSEGDAQFKKRAVLFIREEVKNGFDIAGSVDLFEGILAVSGQDDMTLGAADTLALYHIKKKDWSSVDALLRHKNVEVRQEVVGTIDHSYAYDIPQTTMEILDSFLVDGDDELPLVTALAIAPHARGKADIERIGRVLLVHARHVDPKHSNTAISGIGRLIERAITCSNGLPRAEWGPLRPLVDFMHDLLQHPEKKLNETAAKVLVEYHSHAGEWDAVNKLMLDTRPEIRAASLDHLCHCGYMDCKIDATPAIPAIVDLLPGDRDTLRIISNRIRDRHLQLPVLEAAIRSSKLGVDEAWPYLDKIMEAQPDWRLREAEKQLASLEKQDKLAFVLNIAKSRQGEPRRWAIHQVGNLHSFEHVSVKKAIKDLVMFMSDKDPFIRAESTSVIGFMSMHYDTATAKPDLVNLLGDPAGKIQQNAAMALAAMADKGDDVSISLDALASTLLRSSQADARAQAAIAFYNLARRGADLAHFHETIVQGLKDTNKPTRDFCTWAITQYMMTENNAKRFLDLLGAAGIESTSDAAVQIRKKADSFLK
jgi:HEAT repeat protein